MAELANVQLGAPEVEHLRAELATILDHVAVLRELGGDGVAGPDQPPAASLRDDVEAPDPLQAPLSDLASTLADGFFTVPRIAALDEDAAEPSTP